MSFWIRLRLAKIVLFGQSGWHSVTYEKDGAFEVYHLRTNPDIYRVTFGKLKKK